MSLRTCLPVVAVLACIVLWAAPARADTRAEAKRHFRAGMALISHGDHAGGIAELERAYQLRPHPAVMYNIASAAEAGGDVDRALEAFEVYLESNPPDAAAVRLHVKTLQRQAAAQPAPQPAAPQPQAPQPAAPLTTSPPQGWPAPPQDADPAALRAAAVLARALAAQLLTPDGGSAVDAAVGATPQPDAGPAAGATHQDGGMNAEVISPDGGVIADGGEPPLDASAAGTPAVPVLEAADAIYAETSVTASRTQGDVLDAPAFVTVITREEIDQSAARSIPDLLRRIPGVTVVQMTQSDFNVSIRGLNRRLANKILVLVDGRSVYQDFLGGTAWEAIPVNLEDIERIEVVRGPGAALFGASAFGGVVNIITRQADNDGVEGSAEVGVPRQMRLASRAQGVLTLPGWPKAVTKGCHPWVCWGLARIWRAPRVRAVTGGGLRDIQREELPRSRPDLQRLVEPADGSGRSGRGFAAVEIQGSPDHSLRLEGGAVRLRQDFNAIASLRNYILDGTFFWTQGRYTLGPASVRAFYNRFDADARPELTARAPDPLATHVLTHYLDVEPLIDLPFQYKYVGRHHVMAGANYRFKAVEWSYLGRPQYQHHLGAFIQESWTPLPWLSGNVSVRVDRHPLAPPWYADIPGVGRLDVPGVPGLSPSARGAVVARFGQTAFRIGGGTAFRDPTFLESYVDFELPLQVDAAAFKFVGSRRLLPERIASVEAGFSTRASDRFSVDAAVYAIYVDRIIGTADPVVDLTPGLDGNGRYVLGRGGFENSGKVLLGGGGEVLLRFFPLDGVDVDLGYAQHRLFETHVPSLEGLVQDALGTAQSYATPNAWGARLEDPPYRFIGSVRLRMPAGLEASMDTSVTGPTAWHEESVDATSPTGVRHTTYQIDPYINTQLRVAWRLMGGAVVVSALGQNILAPTHREHPFGDRIGPRGLLSVQVRP